MFGSISAAVFAVAFAASAPAGEPALAVRPWAFEKSVDARALDAKTGSTTDEQRIAGIRFCLDAGLYRQAGELRAKLSAPAALPADLAQRFGVTVDAGKFVPVDATRFTEGEPSFPDAKLVVPTGKARTELLAGRFREIKNRAKSTHFDLWSDLEDQDLVPWTKLLNEYYAGLRNRFSAYVATNIDVLLYASHSDYLIRYARVTGYTGESVLGFYDPGTRLLTFYDDPFKRPDVAITARHECTHLLIDLSYKGAPLPGWFHEGMACFLAADGLAARGQYTSSLVLDLMLPKGKASKITVEQLLGVEPKDLRFEHYSNAWSLVHYLSASKRAAEFQKFQRALRDWVMDQEKPPPVDTVRNKTRELFEASIECTLDRLEFERRDWFEKSFVLERNDQLLDLAAEGVRDAEFMEAPADATWMLDAAHAALETAAADASLANDVRLLRIAQRVRRAELAKCEPDEARAMLVEVRDELRALPPILDESRRARIARRALGIVATAASVGGVSTPRDLRAKLLEKVRSTSDATRKATFQALVALSDDVLGIALGNLARALNANPRNRPAAREWLFLCFEVAPRHFEAIFPATVLMAELDPDDESLAALGLAYRGLGKAGYGDMLITEAKARSAQPGALSEYLRYVK